MKYLNNMTLAAAGGAGTMFGFFVILVIADQTGALDILIEVVRAICHGDA